MRISSIAWGFAPTCGACRSPSWGVRGAGRRPGRHFQRRALSQANLIPTILFGDGAAAAFVTGRPARGPKILEVASHLLPDTIDAMGFDLQGDGFHIILSKEVPGLIRDRIKQILCTTLTRRGLK